MARGYSKVSSYETGNVISASLFNNDFNKLQNAFTYSSTDPANTGHTHDGSAENGGAIAKIGDIDFNNKIEIDGTNNLIKLSIELGGDTSTEILHVFIGGIYPTVSGIDLGTVLNTFDTAYVTTVNSTDVNSTDVNSTDVNTSNLTATTAIILEDEALLKFGTSGSEELVLGYAESINSGIISVGSGEGSIQLNGDEVRLTGGVNENYLVANLNSGVELYYDNAKTFETVDGGVKVTGTLETTGNVGIGETDPDTELHISAAFPKILLQDTDGTNQYGEFYHSNGTTAISARNNTTNGSISFQRYDGTTATTSMRIDTSGNVGIGTTNPTELLDVKGNVNVTYGTDPLYTTSPLLTSNTFSIAQMADISYASQLGAVGAGPLGSWENSRRAVQILFNFNGTGNASFGGWTSTDGLEVSTFVADNYSPSDISTFQSYLNQILNGTYSFQTTIIDDILDGDYDYLVDYKVGINAAPATEALEVGGNIKASGFDSSILLSSSLSNNQIISRGSDSATGRDLTFVQGTSESMRIDTSGNVGINNTSPDHKLHVHGGDIMISSDTTTSTGDGKPALLFSEEHPDNTNSNDAMAGIVYDGDGQSGDANYLGLGIWENAADDQDTLAEQKATTTLNITRNNKVGVGTKTPDAKLHVLGGDIKITSDGDSDSSSDGIPSIIFTEFNDDHPSYNANAAHAVIAYHGTDVLGDANYLGFGLFDQTVATEDTLAEAKLLTDLNITRDGRVGIGTTQPSSKLHLMAPDCDIDQEMSSDSTARLIEHRFKVDGVMESQLGHYMGIEASEGVDAVDPRFEFRSKHDYWFLGGPTGSAPKVAFTNDGKVGIGTTDPAYDSKLNVNGGDIVVSTSSAINHPSILFYDNDDTQVMSESPINAGIVYNDSATDDKNIYLGLSVWEEFDASTMTNLWGMENKKDVTTLNITKGKKVGVNTNTPSAELDVVGKMAVGTSTGIATPESLVSLRLTPAQVANWAAEILHINQQDETVAGTAINASHPYFDIFDLDNDNTVGSADAVTPMLNSAKTHWTDADQQEYLDYFNGTLTNTSTFIEDVLNGEYDYSVKDVILNAPSSGSIIAKGDISSDGLVVNKKLSHSELLTSSISVADLHNYVTNAILASAGSLTVPDKYFNIFDIDRDGNIDSSDVLFISKFIDTDLLFTQAEKDEYDDYADGTLTNNSTFIQDVFNGSYDYRNKKGVIIDKEAANLVTIEGDVQALSLTASVVDGATATFSQGDFSVLTATIANATTVDADTVKTQDIIVYETQAEAVSPLLTADRTPEELSDLAEFTLAISVNPSSLPDYQKALLNFSGTTDSFGNIITGADVLAVINFIVMDTANNYTTAEQDDYDTYRDASPYVYQSTIVSDIRRGDYDYLLAPAKVGINTETPASALDVIGDISVSGNITSDLGLNFTPANGIEMRAGDANGIEMHWWAQTTGTTVAADGEQTKRFHITDSGVHVGDDVTGTYTAGDLQDNQDLDYGFLVGRESDNLGSNNVGIGFDLFFDSFTASNFAQGSVLTLHGGAENCVAFGGNLEIGTSASTTVGIKNSFIGGLYAKTNANNTFTWAEGVLDGSTIYAATNNGTGSVLFAKQGQIDSDSEYSLLGGKIGNNPGAGWIEPSLIDSSYAFSWGFGNVVDGSNGAVVCGSFNSADGANDCLVTGTNNSTLSSNSFVAGLNNSVTNVDTGIAVGKANTVEGDFSVAMGQDNNTLGVAGVCLGKGLKTPLFLTSSFNYEWDNYSVVVGGYNDPTEKYHTAADNSTWVDDHRFVVGTGTSASSKDNGFIVAVPTSDFSGVIMPALAASTSHTNDAAAKLAGVPVGGLYHTNGVVKVVL